MTTLYVDNIAPNLQSRVSVPGHVIQVVNNISTSVTSVTATDTWTDAADFSVSITPTSTNSKILINFGFRYGLSGGNSSTVRLMRNTDALALGANDAFNLMGNTYVAHSSVGQGTDGYDMMYLDSPSTTDPIVYKVQVRQGGTATTLYINSRSDGNTSDCQTYGYITAMEIAG